MTARKDLTACVVVGNLKPGSRTTVAATAVAAGLLGGRERISVVELAPLGGSLFGFGAPAVAEAKAAVHAADLLIVASPVFKASITGLLKAFLDQFGADELRAKASVPVMVGGSPAHSLAVEGQLRPVLVEIGASMPTRGIYLTEAELPEAADKIADWMALWGPPLLAVAYAAATPARVVSAEVAV